MPAPFERRAITYDGKPVLLYVDAPPRAAQPFLARCHGVTLAAQDAGLDEDAYVARLVETAREMGLTATVRRRDDREIALDLKAARRV
jgi:hypothetical protein